MHFVLIDTPLLRSGFYPLSATKPLGRLRLGIVTLQEWWQQVLGQPVYLLSEDYLQLPILPEGACICIDAGVLPAEDCIKALQMLEPGLVLEDENGLIAFATQAAPAYGQLPVWPTDTLSIAPQKRIAHTSDLFKLNDACIRQQFALLTNQRTSPAAHSSNTIIGAENVFIEEGVEMYGCTINALEGPVYIGHNALVMEGSLLRGPIAIGEKAVVKMGAKIYGGTTVGPYCTAGGEIKNTILTAYSNKAHDGYLGDSVIGEWCNFGAGSTNSNVKNTGGLVKMWDGRKNDLVEVGQKAGLIMGDYSRSAINSSFNTGTTIGVSCNVFDGAYPPKHLPSFSWGSHQQYDFEKACIAAANWKKMKGKPFTEQDRLILRHIYGRLGN